MKTKILLPLALFALLRCADAAPPPKAVLIDHSTDSVMDAKTAVAMLREGIPARVWKVYPASKWAFISQVEGGLTPASTCVITARVMMVPLTQTLKAVLFRPEKTATSFDAQAGASAEQCRELARAKLKQAVESVVSSLVKA